MSKSSKIERVLYTNGNHCYLAKSVGTVSRIGKGKLGVDCGCGEKAVTWPDWAQRGLHLIARKKYC